MGIAKNEAADPISHMGFFVTAATMRNINSISHRMNTAITSGVGGSILYLQKNIIAPDKKRNI
jgi:hypothetical protein